MRWSKLKLKIEDLFRPELEMELRGILYRSVSIGVGRFQVLLKGDPIWDIPKDLNIDVDVKSPYQPYLGTATGLIRDYLVTPVADLNSLAWPEYPELVRSQAHIHGRPWWCYEVPRIIRAELLAILQMADRRIGNRRKRETLAAHESTMVLRLGQELGITPA